MTMQHRDEYWQLHEYGLDVERREIWLTGNTELHDEDWGEPGVEHAMATRFLKNLRVLSIKAKTPILVHMKTCGGFWEEGMAIFDAIVACPCDITILSYTHARSMSSLILQAADKRVLMPNSYFMIHYGHMWVADAVPAVISNVDYEKKICIPTMLGIYATRMTTTKGSQFYNEPMAKVIKELKKRMGEHGDVFLTPRATVDWGLADAIFDSDWGKLLKSTSKKRK